MATTVHGNFFSQKNKEHVSNMVFNSIKDSLGIELDESFVSSLLQIMSDAYTTNTKKPEMSINEYVSTLNDIVTKKCYDKVRTTNNNVDFSKLTQKEFAERDYSTIKEEQKIHKNVLQEKVPPTKETNMVYTKIVKKILDFRKDLIDIENHVYFLNLHDTYTINSIDISKFMIEVSENLTSEPYFYIDIENIPEHYKSCIINENKKAIGRCIQSSIICNKTMYVYDPETCIITLSEPLKTNFLNFSFYNYEGVKISLNSISIKKIIKCSAETEEKRYQILSNGSNALKINDTINILSKKSIDKLKDAVYWESNSIKVKDCKQNSIIIDNFEMEYHKTVVLEKTKINSNISLLLCVE